MSMSASTFGGSCFTLHLSSAYHAAQNCGCQVLRAEDRVTLIEFDLRSTITTVFDLMRQSSVFRPGLAVEEIVPLLNKRPVLFIRGLLQLPMLALLKPIFARWNQNAKLLSGHRRGRRISAIVRSGTRKEADNARRKAEGDKKDVQATAVRQELELMQKTCTLNHQPPKSVERSEFKGLDFPEQEFMMSPLPEFTSNALAAYNFVNLPGDDNSEGSSRVCTIAGHFA
ncbi:hypothetical protein F5879DRAFT_923545 [Lentinula edodes]|nr:hypothetical protein F5879DRAFT_923545 [Lentinula edodes]